MDNNDHKQVAETEVMTLEEAASYLRIPRSSLYKLAREGGLPCQKIGKHWRFHKGTINDWLAASVMKERH